MRRRIVNQSPPADSAGKIARVLRVAKGAHCQALDWASFYRAVLGPTGIVRRLFPSPEDLQEFQRTDAYREIQCMLTELRRRRPASISPHEPTTMITVRVPASLHRALRAEAFDRHTTLNKLCISKLLQWIDQEMVPQEPAELAAKKTDEKQAESKPAADLGAKPQRRRNRSA